MSNQVAVVPVGAPLMGTVVIPGSKSLTNRALLVAGMATGTSVLDGVLWADDTEAMIAAVQALGADVQPDRAGDQVVVVGNAGEIAPGPLAIDVRQSGTTARFISAIVAAGTGEYRLDADPQMRARPMHDLVDALGQLGIEAASDIEPGFLPFVTRSGGVVRDRVRIAGHESSQFASGLLMLGPLLPDGLTVELTGEPVSLPYLDMTIAVMQAFGATVEQDGVVYRVAPGGYSACDFTIEPDASSASYFFAAAAITGGSITIGGLGSSSVQGDMAFVDVLEQMGATVDQNPTTTTVIGPELLRGVTVDLRDFSDTAPTFAAAAAAAVGPSRANGIGFIRHKESDRIGAVVTELQRVGVDAAEHDDGFTINPNDPPSVRSGTVQTYDDHRLAMALSLLGLTNAGVVVADPGCVAKTFPDYFDRLAALGVELVHTNMEPTPPLVVAIDGPAGSGKSTVAKAVADRIGVPHLDTGAMYRSVAFACITQGIDLADTDAVTALAKRVTITISDRSVIVDGVDATEAIRGAEVTQAVSAVAANSAVRLELVARQRAWVAELGGGVMEGRDIGTVVFPDAPVKVYLDARPEVRADRRSKEVDGSDIAAIAADIARRDRIDSTREASPLQEADGAVVVDTSDLTIEQVVDAIVALVP